MPNAEARRAKPPPSDTWLVPSRRADVPERVGRYRLTRRVSRGGMGEVFEAFLDGDNGFARRFALKVPLADTELQHLAAFADEARILSQLQHPGIVGVYDFGTDEGWPYQVLEFVDGLDVARLREFRVAGRAFTPALALMISQEAARALHYAHEATDWQGRPLGIIHRDISPQNILVSWRGEVKLIDFGIAKAEGRLAKTEEGIVKGKLSFMSPEQIGGQRVTPRADVFSLGCVLYYMLVGESPYSTTEARARAARGLRPAWVDDFEPDVAAIIERAVALNPKDRHESALEFANDCERALAGRPDATGAALSRWLTGLRRPMPTRAAPSPRTSSVLVVGIDPQEEAPTMANLDLMSMTQAVATSECRAPSPPEQIGPFRILRPLPLGDDVYEAEPADEERPTRIGLKTFECAGRETNELAHRLADAAAMSTVDHDHLLGVLEFGVDGHLLFVAVPRPRGHTLRRVVSDADRSGGLALDEISALAVGLITALQGAREALRCRSRSGVARDLRPETFLLSYDGFPKLMDTLVDGPLTGLSDPSAAEIAGLVEMIEALPGASAADARLREAIDVLRQVQSPRTLSRALRAFRRSAAVRSDRPPNQILSDLMLRLYGSESARAQSAISRALRAPSVVNDTAPLPLRGLPITDGLVTELDPEDFDDFDDFEICESSQADPF